MSETTEATTAPARNPVRDVREALGMTQEALAIELKCSYASVRSLEKDKRVPKNRAVRENFEALATRAGVKLEGTAATPEAVGPAPPATPVEVEDGWAEWRRRRAASEAAKGTNP